MGSYILKRLLLMIPTLFIILLINFVVVQIAPGGPVEQAIHEVESGLGAGRILGTEMYYQGAKGLSPEMVEQIKAQYGFDHPPVERFLLMLKGYLTLDFGQSFLKINQWLSCSGKNACVNFTWAMEHFADLSYFNSARY